MALANILTPNLYNLYCESITVNGSSIINPITSGGYIPVLFLVSGIQNGTLVNKFSYFSQIGNIVTATCKIQYSQNSGGRVVFNITNLPVARTSGNFTDASQVIGSITADDNILFSDSSGVVKAITSTQTIQCLITPSGVNNNQCISNISFTYSIAN